MWIILPLLKELKLLSWSGRALSSWGSNHYGYCGTGYTTKEEDHHWYAKPLVSRYVKGQLSIKMLAAANILRLPAAGRQDRIQASYQPNWIAALQQLLCCTSSHAPVSCDNICCSLGESLKMYPFRSDNKDGVVSPGLSQLTIPVIASTLITGNRLKLLQWFAVL